MTDAELELDVTDELVWDPKCLRNNYCRLFGRVAMIGVAKAS